MRRLFFSVIILICCCLAPFAMAMPVSNLYQATVPVASQSSTLRETALQQALSQVFIKTSGSTAVVKINGIASAINQPAKYLSSYGYQDAVLPNGSSTLMLQASFDANLIQSALKSAGQNVWGQNRPLVLVWLAVTQANSPAALVADNANTPIQQLVKYDAAPRAIPILFPILDLSDLKAISINDVTSANLSALEQASTRYNSDAILAVNLQQISDQVWNGTWTLLSQNNATTWQTNNMTLNQAINAGVNAITDNLAAKFTVSPVNTGSTVVQLTVMNINNLTDYAKVTNYLKGFSLVQQVDLDQIQPSSLIYKLTINGDSAALQQALSLDHHLQPVTNAPASGDTNSNAGLVYQWIS